MTGLKICASIVNDDLEAVRRVEPLVDLYEVRIDLIGSEWREVAGQLKKPWIACNRKSDEGGTWRGGEEARIAELLNALELGAEIIDVELSTEGLGDVVSRIKKRAECLISYHDVAKTPSIDVIKGLARKQLAAGADICKVVTTAQQFEDNVSALRLIREFPEERIISFAMGPLGLVSRILCPLVGGEFIYAAIETGKEAASGQLTVSDLREIYQMVKR
ncbi:MAG: type I 3-dehydroquinate dehydratase [Dehalococcoidia bacterium]|nr:type I 3-dehydroquinate dehydratase [Dehalococcoidia bacterium]MBL7126063.1 type I 3-dehydroquinate dehydratase [Dehalococcoidales bacterium]